MNLLLKIALTLNCLLLVQNSSEAKDAPKPNIVLIFCDDLGYADVGFNAELFDVKTDVVTPNIDALAKKSTVFKQAYVAHPFCGPSRMALLTGRMPHTFGGQKNLSDHSKNLLDYNQKGVPVEETLFSKVLQEAGYWTGCIGKWHMGAAKDFHPNVRGFDEFYGFIGGGHQYYPSITDKTEPKINDYQYFLERNGTDFKSPEGAYITDMFSDESVKFISKGAKKKDPFFLYLAYNAPHSPLQGKTEDLKKLYPNHKLKNPGNGVNFQDYEKRQNYVAMMYAVDRGVGQIVNALDDPNNDGDKSDSISKNTLIVFLSDNGGKILQAGNNAPLLDDKGSTHEGGIRVPMFMHWPGTIPQDSVFEHPVLAIDFYPTFAGLAGANIPTKKKLDGKNVWQDFVAGKNPHKDETLFWLRHHGPGNEVAIRRNNMKAHRKIFGAWKMHDMSIDIGEKKDVANAHQELLVKLLADGLKWSQTHIAPQWHDTKGSLTKWVKNKMPKYAETFSRRKEKK